MPATVSLVSVFVRNATKHIYRIDTLQTIKNNHMIYYLLSEEHRYSIYLVRKSEQDDFIEKNGSKIVLNACNISRLLLLFNKESENLYYFSKN